MLLIEYGLYQLTDIFYRAVASGGVWGGASPPQKMQPVGKSRQIYVCTYRQIGINWENGKRLKTMKTFKAWLTDTCICTKMK